MGTYKEESRREWTPNGRPTDREDIKAGCLQRIADATEVMAKNHAQLVRDKEWYERRYKEGQASGQRMARRISALQGVITRMKKKAASK